VPLFLVSLTTLLLLSLSPMVRLTRATFFVLALMLVVFAAWALSGFGYPSAPLPTTLNIAAKLLSFAAALTLFLPQRPRRQQPPRPHRNERGRACQPAAGPTWPAHRGPLLPALRPALP
jgi:hypothetical protein